MKLDIENYQKIVIKIGSAILVEDYKIRKEWLDYLAKNIKELKQKNLEIVIVSSGAVALGRAILKKQNDQKLTLSDKQACASIGQIQLMSFYHEIFKKNNLKVAQILLTASDCNHHKRFNNCNNTIKTLLANDIIPIINENDSVAIEEIKIGDNDRLASRVCQMIEANLLILFSDIDGLYDQNPKIYPNAKHIEIVNKIDKKIENMAKGSTSKIASGGMITKILAAKMALNTNCSTIITKGIENNALTNLVLGKKRFTFFYQDSSKIVKSKTKKKWLSGLVNIDGILIINKLASSTIQNKKASLLAVGVVAVKGNFDKGDVVSIFDETNQHIANGVVNYSKQDAQKILLKNSLEIKKILGNKAKPELVHLDNLVIIK
jgi:glutamate 5-kinase